jgi:DNA-binding CsgD family transcriptional regulator
MSIESGCSNSLSQSHLNTPPVDVINVPSESLAKSKSTVNVDSLDMILMQSLNDSNMVVCVKDANKFVLKQNDACKTLCGDREGEKCCIGCMEVYDADKSQQWNTWGNRTYKNCFLHESFYNVTILCSEQHLTTILQPLEQKHAKAIEYYKDLGLSKRELEVISLVITGYSNIDICQDLNISKATLRSHLNNVYSKVSDAGGSLAHLPQERSSAGSVYF